MDALLARLREGNVLWLLHVNADADCVGAAFALRDAFGGDVGAPDGLSKAGAALARRLKMHVDDWPHPEQYRTLVAVDTSSRSQLGRLGPRVGDPCLVDHHAYGDLLSRAPAAAHDSTRSSCCEVALALLDHAQLPPGRDAAFALLAGLVDDSARFLHANAATFRDAARLLDASGATMDDVLKTLAGDEEDGDDASQRKATLLAATRARIESVGACLVAVSEVSAFDAAAASALVRAGADLAVVASERSDRARMSLRAHPRAGLHLGHIANEAARSVAGWSGGGHEGAAGLSGPPPAATARDAVLKLARGKLEEAQR